jgi:hypothetical protein
VIEHAYDSCFVNDIAGQKQRLRAVPFDIAHRIECRVFTRHVVDSDRPPTRGRQGACGTPDTPRAAGYKKVRHGLIALDQWWTVKFDPLDASAM